MSKGPGSRRHVGVVPPLRGGERLSLAEFERRYDATPNLKLGELIEGVVHLKLTVRHTHARANSGLVGWLGLYQAYTPGLDCGAHGHIRLDEANMLQPDAELFIEASRGGRTHISADGYIEGGPELVAEVCDDPARLDATVKRGVYERHGTCEHLVWNVHDDTLDWRVLSGTSYRPVRPGRDGVTRSTTFPGLWLDSAALLGGDMKAVMRVLQLGLASPEHAAFVERLGEAGQ